MSSELYDMVGDLNKKQNIPLVLATVWIINNLYAFYTRSPLHIGHYATTKAKRWQHEDLVKFILMNAAGKRNGSGTPNIRFLVAGKDLSDDADDDDDDSNHYVISKEKAIWLIDGLKAFRALERDLVNNHNNYQRNGFFCIIYTGEEFNRFVDMKAIFQRLFQIYALNVNVLLTIGNSLYVYTYFPFKRNHCHNSNPELHLSFRSLNRVKDFKLKKQFFPNKVSNMWGCDVKVTTWTDHPFIVVERDPKTNKILFMHGIEGLLLSAIAEKMNFTMTLKEPKTRERGYFSENGTSSGATKMLIDGETNITIAGYMYDKVRSDYTLPAYPYLSTPLVLAVPKGRKMSPFERLVRPFRYIIWSCLSSSVLFALILIFTLRLCSSRAVRQFVFGHYNEIPCTNLLNLLWGGPFIGRLPHRNFARYILILFMVYTWIFRNVYTSELFIILQDGRARTTLQTIDEVIRLNFTFYTNPILLRVLEVAKHNWKVAVIDSKPNSIERLLDRLSSENARIVVTAYLQRIRAYNRDVTNQARQVTTLSQPLFISLNTLYLRSHSYLAHQFNALLLYLMSSGFVQKSEEMYLASGASKRRSNNQQPIELSAWLLLGVFCVYFFLLLLSFFVFLLELHAKRSRILKKIINFFNY